MRIIITCSFDIVYAIFSFVLVDILRENVLGVQKQADALLLRLL